MPRKQKYNEPTKVIGIRVPISVEKKFKEDAQAILNSYYSPEILHTKDGKKLIIKHPVLNIENNFNCGCQLIGHSETGKEIWKLCKEHKV